MYAFARIANLVVRALLAISLILLVAGAVGLASLHLRGQQLLSVQTASMVPAFRPGDALIVEPVSISSLHIGDIISYQSPRDTGVIISHRLIAIDKGTGELITAGDVLHTPDQPFPPRQVVGRPEALLPRFGIVLDFIRRPIGLALAIYLPAMVIVILEVKHLVHHYQTPHYRLVSRYLRS